jgi:hypothetical protein
MEMSALNSLAEVGVGVNLAFSVIKSVREILTVRLIFSLDSKMVYLKATLSDLCKKNGASIQPKDDSSSQMVQEIMDVKQLTETIFSKSEKIFLILSLVSSFSLIYFLFESALNPTKQIESYWAVITLGVVVLPTILNYTIQYAAYTYASWAINRKSSALMKAISIIRQSIEPTAPSAEVEVDLEAEVEPSK